MHYKSIIYTLCIPYICIYIIYTLYVYTIYIYTHYIYIHYIYTLYIYTLYIYMWGFWHFVRKSSMFIHFNSFFWLPKSVLAWHWHGTGGLIHLLVGNPCDSFGAFLSHAGTPVTQVVMDNHDLVLVHLWWRLGMQIMT